MKGLAGHLQGLRCTVKIMLPDGDDGADVADWLEGHDLETVMDTIGAGLFPYAPTDPFEALRLDIEQAIKNDDEPSVGRSAITTRKDRVTLQDDEGEVFRYGWLIGRRS